MITVRIKENSKQAKAVVEMLKTFPFVEILEKPRYNSATERAIKEAKEGKSTPTTLEELRGELYS